MIVRLANTVCEDVGEIDRLDKIKDNKSAINSTSNMLQEIIKDVKLLTIYTSVISSKLSITFRKSIFDECESVLFAVLKSQNNFNYDFHQFDALSRVKDELQEMIEKMKSQWQTYANACAREPLQLLNLVRYLSDVKDHRDIYDDLTRKIQSFIDKVPENLEQLATFEQSVQELAQRLNTIELDVDVKEFLQKVIDRQATMKDFTPKIRTWCQTGDREHDFKIIVEM